MYFHIGLHLKPIPGKETVILESMKSFGQAMQGKPGRINVWALKDERQGALIGFAVWESKEHMIAALPDMQAAITGVDFSELELSEPMGFGCTAAWSAKQDLVP